MNQSFDKDNIDELLRAAFAGHEETPSSQVWESIERNLGRPQWPLWPWILSGLLLLAGVAVLRFGGTATKPAVHAPAGGETNRQEETTSLRLGPASAFSPAGVVAAVPERSSGEGRKVWSLAPEHGGFSQAKLIPVMGTAAGSAFSGDSVYFIENQNIILKNTEKEADEPARTLRDLTPIGLRECGGRNLAPTAFPPSFSLIHPAKVKRWPRISAGIHFTSLAHWQSVKILRPRPVRPDVLPVALTAEAGNSSWENTWGLSVVYSATRHWRLWSGFQFRRIEFHLLHRAQLRRSDGLPAGGTGLRYRYMLNTASGGVAVDVRMEQVDTTLQLPPAEPVSFELRTAQTLRYYSVPLAAGYHVVRGRWGFSLRGGIQANLLWSSDLTVERFVSRNLRFRPARLVRPLVSNDYLRKVSVDFLLGAGADFHPNSRLWLHLEPLFLGQLVRNNRDPYLRTSDSAFGLNAGIFYRF